MGTRDGVPDGLYPLRLVTEHGIQSDNPGLAHTSVGMLGWQVDLVVPEESRRCPATGVARGRTTASGVTARLRQLPGLDGSHR